MVRKDKTYWRNNGLKLSKYDINKYLYLHRFLKLIETQIGKFEEIHKYPKSETTEI